MRSSSKSSDSTDGGLAVALRLLTRRDHSRAELAAKLVARGFDPMAVDQTLTRLTELRYLDDRRLAESLAANLASSGRGVGRRLELELRRRGIPAELAAEVAAASQEQTDELAVARRVLARRYPTYTPTVDRKERHRVMAYLLRRGFAMATVWQVLSISAIEGTDDR